MATDKIEAIRGRLAQQELYLPNMSGVLREEVAIYCTHVRILLEEIDLLEKAIESNWEGP